MENIKEQFAKYCTENWDLPQYETDMALDYMNRYRCPLSRANERVEDYIKSLAEDFAYDNDLNIDWIDGYDIEEIFWLIEF